jgi:hypothetical protein
VVFFCADISRRNCVIISIGFLRISAVRDEIMPIFVRTIWFDEHDQPRARLLMKLVCNPLQQRLSLFVILRKPYQRPRGRFRRRRRVLFSRGARNNYPEKSQWVTLLFSNQREAARAWGRSRSTTARSSFSLAFGKNAKKTMAMKQNARAAFREGDRGKAAASGAAVRKNNAFRANCFWRG